MPTAWHDCLGNLHEKKPGFFCNSQNCSLSMDQQKWHDIVYLKLSNENGLWIWKSKIKYEKYISSYATFFS